jgi:hypothetical protein
MMDGARGREWLKGMMMACGNKVTLSGEWASALNINIRTDAAIICEQVCEGGGGT